MKITALVIHKALKELADVKVAKQVQGYFKTGKGEYGEGDIFLGIRVPVLRKQVKIFKEATLADALLLLVSKYHEERLFALLLLVEQFSRATLAQKEAIFTSYLNHTAYINNWDLVDLSAHQIVGAYLENKNKKTLYTLAESDSLWERRISIISTFHLIRLNRFNDTLKISRLLLPDKEDLIHKAVGWMLREVGKRNINVEKEFLLKYYKKMPRTMLRYAIEKFPESERKKYLQGEM